MTPVRIIKKPSAYWHAVVIGNDLLVRGALVTWFGGTNDPQDNGDTASGINTRDDPNILGCALPMRGFVLPMAHKAKWKVVRQKIQATAGSPIPKIPWQTPIVFTDPLGNSLTVPLIDLGPALKTNHAADLTVAAFKKLGGDLNLGLLSLDFRIPNGAKYLA